MFMKNIDVYFMVNSGTLNITNHELDPKSAYKIVKFRNALNKALDKIQELEKSMLKDCDIEDAQALNKEMEELRKNNNGTPEENKKLAELEEKTVKYNKLRSEMLEEEVNLDGVKTISYEDWHTLRKENKPKKDGDTDPLNNYIESVLENVL